MKRFSNWAAISLGVLALPVLGACGGSSSTTTSSAAAGGPGLRVLAASSLKEVFPKMAAAFSEQTSGVKVTFEFAGSDELATQLQEGAKADVYAAASTKYPDQLSASGTVETPVPFATNTLVLATPKGSSKVPDLNSLSTPGVKLVIGAVGVPIGDYTRKVLAALDAAQGAGWSAAVLKNVVSSEQNVKSIVAKLQSGDADAGLVYVTDATAAGTDLTTVTIPPAAQPTVTYPIAIVSSSTEKGLAQDWVDFVLSAEGQRMLVDAGFGAAPTA